jgi:hypothetical protein
VAAAAYHNYLQPTASLRFLPAAHPIPKSPAGQLKLGTAAGAGASHDGRPAGAVEGSDHPGSHPCVHSPEEAPQRLGSRCSSGRLAYSRAAQPLLGGRSKQTTASLASARWGQKKRRCWHCAARRCEAREAQHPRGLGRTQICGAGGRAHRRRSVRMRVMAAPLGGSDAWLITGPYALASRAQK